MTLKTPSDVSASGRDDGPLFSPTDVGEILPRLRALDLRYRRSKAQRSNWVAECPVCHGPGRPLLIVQGFAGVLVMCRQTACERASILAALAAAQPLDGIGS